MTFDRHHLLRILEQRDREGRRCPRFEWCFIPLAMFVGVLGILQTADLKDSLGTPKDVWHAFWIGALILTGGGTVVLFAWWLVDLVWHLVWRKRKTPDQVVDDVIDQMSKDDAAFEARQSRLHDPGSGRPGVR